MNIAELSAILAGGAFAAGFLGSLTGLGGGVVIVPLLTLALGIDIRYAIGASLIAVIATSSGAAAAYVREGYTNIRIGMFLEIATSVGALTGLSLPPSFRPPRLRSHSVPSCCTRHTCLSRSRNKRRRTTVPQIESHAG